MLSLDLVMFLCVHCYFLVTSMLQVIPISVPFSNYVLANIVLVLDFFEARSINCPILFLVNITHQSWI